jgi:hypothetical protein
MLLFSDEYSQSVDSTCFYTSYEATFMLISWSESAMVICKVVDPSLVLHGGCVGDKRYSFNFWIPSDKKGDNSQVSPVHSRVHSSN